MKHTALIFLTTAIACGGPDTGETTATQDAVCSAVKTNRELMIRNLSVVNDPVRMRWTGGSGASDGAWQFGRLMTNMAGTQQNASDFVRDWLSNWEVDRT